MKEAFLLFIECAVKASDAARQLPRGFPGGGPEWENCRRERLLCVFWNMDDGRIAFGGYASDPRIALSRRTRTEWCSFHNHPRQPVDAYCEDTRNGGRSWAQTGLGARNCVSL